MATFKVKGYETEKKHLKFTYIPCEKKYFKIHLHSS